MAKKESNPTLPSIIGDNAMQDKCKMGPPKERPPTPPRPGSYHPSIMDVEDNNPNITEGDPVPTSVTAKPPMQVSPGVSIYGDIHESVICYMCAKAQETINKLKKHLEDSNKVMEAALQTDPSMDISLNDSELTTAITLNSELLDSL